MILRGNGTLGRWAASGQRIDLFDLAPERTGGDPVGKRDYAEQANGRHYRQGYSPQGFNPARHLGGAQSDRDIEQCSPGDQRAEIPLWHIPQGFELAFVLAAQVQHARVFGTTIQIARAAMQSPHDEARASNR